MTFAGSTAATCASSGSSGRGRGRFAFLLLLLAYLFLASLFNATVPLGEGPDEPGHLNYVLFLAREGRLPVQREPQEQSDVPGEGHQPPLAYGLALPAVLWLPPDERHIEQSANPDFRWHGGSDPAAFVRASREYWPWQGEVLAWHLARGVSTLLGAVTVFCVWGAARTLTKQGAHEVPPHLPLLAAVLVAFNPQFLFTSALVTNDALLTTLSALLLWLCLLGGPYAPAAPASPVPGSALRPLLLHAVATGAVLGLALLTKQSGLLLIPLALWGSWLAGRGRVRWVLLHGLCWMGAALLVAGWWYGRNWHLYGDPLGVALFRAAFTTQPFEWSNPAAWGGALRQLHASFWATFGWLSVRPPAWSLALYALLEALALVGLLRLARRLHATGGATSFPPLVPLILLPLLAFAWVVSFAFTAGLVAWQGRLLFPALAALAILLAWGLSVVLPRLVWRGVLPAALCSLALAFPFATIAPAYVWHTLPPEQAQARIAIPTCARYAQAWERGIELRGWRMHTRAGTVEPGRTVRAGQTLTVTFTWHALERVPHDLVVFVHLVRDAGIGTDGERDGSEPIGAEHNGRPHRGQFPTPLWTPGDWVEDAHPLALPADLTPGRYVVRVGLWHWPHRGKRQPAWNCDGSALGSYHEVGAITLLADPP